MWWCLNTQLWLVKCSTWEFISALTCCIYSVYEKFLYEGDPCGPPAWVITNIHIFKVFCSVDVSQCFEFWLRLIVCFESYCVPVAKALAILICVSLVFSDWQTFCILTLCHWTTTELTCSNQWVYSLHSHNLVSDVMNMSDERLNDLIILNHIIKFIPVILWVIIYFVQQCGWNLKVWVKFLWPQIWQ